MRPIVMMPVACLAVVLLLSGGAAANPRKLLAVSSDGSSSNTSGPVKHSVSLSLAPDAPLRTDTASGAASTTSGAGASGSTSTLPDYTDYTLPFCDPAAGVLCADFDILKFLDVQPDQITFDGTPLAELQAAGEVQGSTGATLSAFGGQLSTATGTGAALGITSNIGTEGFNADVVGDTTLTGVTIDASKLDQPFPDSVDTTVAQTNTVSLVNRITYNPRLQIIPGLNFGLPFGLATVTESGP